MVADVNPGVCSSYVFNQSLIRLSLVYGEFFVKETERVLYIGGGAGMAPMVHIIPPVPPVRRKKGYFFGDVLSVSSSMKISVRWRDSQLQFPRCSF